MTLGRQPVAVPPACTVTDLRSQVADGVLVIGTEPVRLTWRVDAGGAARTQLAYECQASGDASFDPVGWTSGVVEAADQVAVATPGPALVSREVRYFRVRVRTEEGWTDWSRALRVEAGLLKPGDWHASAVTLPGDPGRERPSPSPVLRREFGLEGEVERARLYVTALGVYRLSINGVAVGDGLLSPGWTTYRHRFVADTYDVASLLRRGANVIVATLGDGWYRGRLGWEPDGARCQYGSDVGLVAQLEVVQRDATTRRVVTDEAWLASTGEIMAADLYDGSLIDLRERLVGCEQPGYDTGSWRPVAVVSFDPALVEPRVAPPVRAIETIPTPPIPKPGAADPWTGCWAEHRGLRPAPRPGPAWHPGHCAPRRGARAGRLAPHARPALGRATDTYVLADDAETLLEPAFTFHGFRYAEVETEAAVLAADCVAISSATPPRSSFECADAMLTRLHERALVAARQLRLGAHRLPTA